ncbi:hypothetical protein AVEN_109721-2-1, partial [Araneus ventricosus]
MSPVMKSDVQTPKCQLNTLEGTEMPPLGLEMGRKFSTNEALCSLGQRSSPSYPEPTTWT